MADQDFEIKSVVTSEVEDKVDAISFEKLLNDNLSLSDYGTGLKNMEFTFVATKPDEPKQNNQAAYDPIFLKISLQLNLNYHQMIHAKKNDVSKMMASLFLNAIDVIEKLCVPEFKKGKFFNDVEGLFFRRGLLLFE